MVMFCYRIIILLISVGALYSQIPFKYSLDGRFVSNREITPGFPSPGVADLKDGFQNNSFAGTARGVGLIDHFSFNNNGEVDGALYTFEVDFFDGNNDGINDINPALRTYLLDNGQSLVIASLSFNYNNDPKLPYGTGIVWSEDSGTTWRYIEQPVEDSNGMFSATWYNQQFNYRGVDIGGFNLAYDVAADIDQEYIYIASWAGMLRRFNYSDSNPRWEVVPLPMDNQNSLDCNGIDNDYFYDAFDETGFDNHKPFSVYINDYNIWVGTAGGINKGTILQNGCINWERYYNQNTNFDFGYLGNWTVGIHEQYFKDFTRLWAITWQNDDETPHSLSYTDNNGNSWHTDNYLKQFKQTVVSNFYTFNKKNTQNNYDVSYAATNKGLYKIELIPGCMDPTALNYNPNANFSPDCDCPTLDCTYDLNIIDGCDLPINNLYLVNGEVLYNSEIDIKEFQFSIDGTTASASSGGDADVAGLIISVSESNVVGFSFSGATIPAGCGTLTSLTLDGSATGLSDIVIDDPCFNYYSNENNCIDDDLLVWDEVSIRTELDGYPVYSAIGDNFGNLWVGAADGLYSLPNEIPIIDPNANTNYFTRVPNESCIITGDCKKELMIYPNPFFPKNGNKAKFLLEITDPGKLEIYNFAGKKIDTEDCSLDEQPGYLVCYWDGYNKSSHKVSNGVYFCKIKSGKKEYWQKLGLVNIK